MKEHSGIKIFINQNRYNIVNLEWGNSGLEKFKIQPVFWGILIFIVAHNHLRRHHTTGSLPYRTRHYNTLTTGRGYNLANHYYLDHNRYDNQHCNYYHDHYCIQLGYNDNRNTNTGDRSGNRIRLGNAALFIAGCNPDLLFRRCDCTGCSAIHNTPLRAQTFIQGTVCFPVFVGNLYRSGILDAAYTIDYYCTYNRHSMVLYATHLAA